MLKRVIKTEQWAILNNFRLKKEKGGNPILTYLYKKGDWLYATTGKTCGRLHFEAFSTIEDGLYEVITAKKKNKIYTDLILEKKEECFPEIAEIFDAIKETHKILSVKLNPTTSLNFASCIINLYRETETYFDYGLLEQLSTKKGNPEIYSIYGNGKDKTIYLKGSKGLEAIIMPFQG